MESDVDRHSPRLSDEMMLQSASTAFAMAAVGLLSGWLTGHSGHDAIVVAAVVPAIIAAGGTAAVVAARKGGSNTAEVVSAIGIIILSITFAGGSLFGAYQRDLNIRAETVDAIDKHHRFLEICSVKEHETNTGRAALGLQPLSSEYFCEFPR